MQIFGPRTSTAGTIYTAAQVQAALTAPTRRETFVWDRLDQAGRPLDDLTPFVDTDTPPVITYDTTLAVKRSIAIRFKGDVPLYKGGVLSLNNQIRGHHRIQMLDGGWVDFTMGTFVVLPAGGPTSPSRTWHDLGGFDYGQLLLDYNFQDTVSVPAGISAVNAVASLLSIPGARTALKMVIPDLGTPLAMPITWDPGMSRLKAINDVLAAVNYFPAWFDAMGVMRSGPIPDWNTVSPVFTFDSTQGSILWAPFTQTVDWAQAGNIQDVYVEDPRRPAFRVTYVNVNPLSPISIQNYHPKSLPPIKDSNIPDVASAARRAKSACQAAARLFQTTPMPTSIWPLSEDQDIYGVAFTDHDDGPQRLAVVEMGSTTTCQAGGGTMHTFTQLVQA